MFSPVYMTPAISCSQVSTTPAKNLSLVSPISPMCPDLQKEQTSVVNTVIASEKFISGSPFNDSPANINLPTPKYEK
jgi:hypothetical protein